MGAEVDFVREAGPKAIAEHFARLEAKGEIVAIDRPSPEAGERAVNPEETEDIEPYPEDEDVEPIELWRAASNQGMNEVVLGGGANPHEISGENDKFELVISDGVCAFHSLEWAWSYKPESQRAEKQLSEIATRCRVFRQLAAWLNLHRPDFLKSGDFWHLGPASLEEVERYCAVMQKEMPAILGIASLTEETFSRYVQRCELAWADDGSASLQILFSKQVRLAWVARSVVLFARKSSKPLRERLDKLRDVTRRRDAAGDKSSAIRGTMPFEKFIRRVNETADTSWQEVLSNYETTMLHENDHGKKD
ncbi:MAG: hypothetical protein IH623_10205 [Verrucomicrobia bacterium]|nr:hypothetical protein [Verrucomicrobiota bacterium]